MTKPYRFRMWPVPSDEIVKDVASLQFERNENKVNKINNRKITAMLNCVAFWTLRSTRRKRMGNLNFIKRWKSPLIRYHSIKWEKSIFLTIDTVPHTKRDVKLKETFFKFHYKMRKTLMDDHRYYCLQDPSRSIPHDLLYSYQIRLVVRVELCIPNVVQRDIEPAPRPAVGGARLQPRAVASGALPVAGPRRRLGHPPSRRATGRRRCRQKSHRAVHRLRFPAPPFRRASPSVSDPSSDLASFSFSFSGLFPNVLPLYLTHERSCDSKKKHWKHRGI